MQLLRHTSFGPAAMLSRLLGWKERRENAVPPGRRIYAIGDIHGRLDLFERLLTMIEEDQQGREPIAPEIVLLGDMIDRGPDSAGVVKRAMALSATRQLTALMGNHEASLIEALGGTEEAMRTWLRFGGVESLLSWGMPRDFILQATAEEIAAVAGATIPPDELSWLERLRHYARIGDYYFVHAGVRPGVELDQQAPQDSLWIREDFLDSRRDHGAMIVHGHTISPEIEECDNRIGIDTGAYYSDRLSALALEGASHWFLQTSSDPARDVAGA